MIRSIFAEAGKYIPTKVLPALVGLLVIPIFTRIFDPEIYGQYGLAVSIISFGSIFTSGWLSNANMRFWVECKTDIARRDHLSTLIISTLVFSFMVSLLIYGIMAHVSMLTSTFLIAAVVMLFFTPFIQVILSYYRIQNKPFRYTVFDQLFNSGKLLLGLLAVLIIFPGLGLKSVFWSGSLIALILLLFFLLSSDIRSRLAVSAFSFSRFRHFLAYGFPLVLVLVSKWILTLSARFIIPILRPDAPYELGWLTASQNIVDRTLTLLFQALMMAVLPNIFSAWETSDKKTVRHLMTQLIGWFFILFFPLAVGMSLLAEPVMDLMTGNQYMGGAVIIPYLAMGAFLANLTHYITIPCSLHKKTLIMTRITIVSAVVNLLLYLVFIPWLGFSGVGVALILTYVFMILYSVYSVRRFSLIKFPWKMIIQTITAAVVMALVVILLKSLSPVLWISITTSILGGGIAYILILRLMGVWSFDKIRDIGKPDITP